MRRGLDQSPTHQVLIERSVIGWKEFELEVMRDHDDNVVIVCSIENLDPMGVHTGDSITVAPAMTLTDREYQAMRDAAVAIIREVGVEAGGCNIQFAVNPRDGEMLVIEMNPRVSRSSALASKATGFPDRAHRREARRRLPARRDRERHHEDDAGVVRAGARLRRREDPALRVREVPDADPHLTTQMKSVGEAMAIGRTFKEAFQKGLRALETGRSGWNDGDALASTTACRTIRSRRCAARCASRRRSASSR